MFLYEIDASLTAVFKIWIELFLRSQVLSKPLVFIKSSESSVIDWQSNDVFKKDSRLPGNFGHFSHTKRESAIDVSKISQNYSWNSHHLHIYFVDNIHTVNGKYDCVRSECIRRIRSSRIPLHRIIFGFCDLCYVTMDTVKAHRSHERFRRPHSKK